MSSSGNDLPDVDAAYSAAAGKRWQLEREIEDLDVSRAEKSNMRHSLLKLWLFVRDTCDAYERALDRMRPKSETIRTCSRNPNPHWKCCDECPNYRGPACPTCGSDNPPLPGTSEYHDYYKVKRALDGEIRPSSAKVDQEK